MNSFRASQILAARRIFWNNLQTKDLLPRFVVQELELDVLPLLVLVHLLHGLVAAPVVLGFLAELLLVLLQLLQAALPVVLAVLGLAPL